MAKFTNYTNGPKGLNALSGLVDVSPGQTVDVEISDAEAASAKKIGWFTAPKGAEPAEDKKATPPAKADEKKA